MKIHFNVCVNGNNDRRKPSKPSLGVRGFWWVAFTAILGVAVNQNAYFAGIDLSSSSMASATTNLVPAVTFIISIIVGLVHNIIFISICMVILF